MPSAKVTPTSNNFSIRNAKILKQYNVPNKGSEECSRSSKNESIEERLTPYQKILCRLSNDERWYKEISLEKRIGFYKFHGELGTGNFSQVKSAIHCLTKERVAIKILDKSKLDKKTQKMLGKEIESMESVHHPNLIRLFEVIETHSKYFLVMEYAGGGELFHRISNEGKFSEGDARPIYAQIVDAVDHMHRHNIIHRDLKAENVFFVNRNLVKVGDFGFSTSVRDPYEALRTFCGSPPYAAPELFQDDSYLGPAVDAWAMGVLLFFMLTASMPFRAPTVPSLKKLILEAEFFFPPYVSEDCQWIIRGLLRKDPTKRFTIENIKTYRWLSEYSSATSLPVFAMQPHKPKCQDAPLPLQEVEARRQLKELGITDAILAEGWDKGVKSNVTGTYRITVHKLINPSNDLEDDASDSSESVCSTSIDLTNCSSKITSRFVQNKKSKTCHIL